MGGRVGREGRAAVLVPSNPLRPSPPLAASNAAQEWEAANRWASLGILEQVADKSFKWAH